MKEFSDFLRFSKFLGKCCKFATLGIAGSRSSVFVLTLSEQIYRTFKHSFAGLIAYLVP